MWCGPISAIDFPCDLGKITWLIYVSISLSLKGEALKKIIISRIISNNNTYDFVTLLYNLVNQKLFIQRWRRLQVLATCRNCLHLSINICILPNGNFSSVEDGGKVCKVPGSSGHHSHLEPLKLWVGIWVVRVEIGGISVRSPLYLMICVHNPHNTAFGKRQVCSHFGPLFFF